MKEKRSSVFYPDSHLLHCPLILEHLGIFCQEGQESPEERRVEPFLFALIYEGAAASTSAD
jgi:hypothetical protein